MSRFHLVYIFISSTLSLIDSSYQLPIKTGIRVFISLHYTNDCFKKEPGTRNKKAAINDMKLAILRASLGHYYP